MPATAASERIIDSVAQRRPDLGRAQRESFGVEALRQHSDDFKLPFAQLNLAADHVRIAAELGLPEFVTQNKDAPLVGLIFFGSEVATQDRPYANRRKEIVRNAAADERTRCFAGNDRLPV